MNLFMADLSNPLKAFPKFFNINPYTSLECGKVNNNIGEVYECKRANVTRPVPEYAA